MYRIILLTFQDFPFDNHECDFEYWVKEESIIKLNTTSWVWYKKNSINDTKNTLIITNTTTPFIVFVEINPVYELLDSFPTSGIKIILHRDTIGLLIGSFYVPTGIFAILSIASYVIHPDIVSF